MQTTKQPSGLYILFFAELWERYSFYTMQTLLVLFLIKNFGFTDSQAYILYGSFSALIYFTPILGGYIADRFIGYRMAIYTGSVFYIVGLFLLAFFGKQVFYSSLGFLIIGNGFFKSNVSTLLGTLYEKNDIRRDSGFTLFYLGINLGSLLASFLSAYLATQYGWYFAFGAAGIGMSIGLIVCLKTFSRLGTHGLVPSLQNSHYYIYAGAILAVFLK